MWKSLDLYRCWNRRMIRSRHVHWYTSKQGPIYLFTFLPGHWFFLPLLTTFMPSAILSPTQPCYACIDLGISSNNNMATIPSLLPERNCNQGWSVSANRAAPCFLRGALWFLPVNSNPDQFIL